MGPLSCVNCCHNPLQLGPVGTSFGYCTRHAVVLTHPQLTTCGQLLRKDLLFTSAKREQLRHAKDYPEARVVLAAAPEVDARKKGFVETPNGQLPPDAVLEEVQSYGALDSKIATMAALHRISGSRAEVAMLSLSRGYFRNCVERGGRWTAGIHVAFWTLRRLDEDPPIKATDLRGPIGLSLGQTIAIARWTIIALRLALLADVGSRARQENDRMGVMADLAANAVGAVRATDPDRLLAWLSRKRPSWTAALTPKRYALVWKELHRDPS